MTAAVFNEARRWRKAARILGAAGALFASAAVVLSSTAPAADLRENAVKGPAVTLTDELQRNIRLQRQAPTLATAGNQPAAASENALEHHAIYHEWNGIPMPFWLTPQVLSAAAGLFLVLLVAMTWWRYRSIMRLNARLQESLAERDQVAAELSRDKTQLKDAEAALGQSEARFRDLATSASDWFWEMDENLRFSYFSERFSEITGLAQDQLLGKTRQATGIRRFDDEAWRQHMEDLAAHRPFRAFVHPRTGNNGEDLWFSINGTPFFDDEGAFKGYRGTGSDITERIRTEDLLRESEHRLQAIMDHVPAALFLKDREARYVLINRQFQDWFGVDRATVMGKTGYELFPKERAERYAQGDRKILDNWQVTTDEVVIPDPTGGDKNFTLTKFPIFNSGEPVGFGGVMMDITARTQADLAVRQSENRAKMANRAKSEFLANMSHELRTPLNAVIGFAEIIKNGMLDPDGDDKNREYAHHIYDSGQHLLDLINDILDISKIELGSVEPNEVEIAVPQLIDSVLVLIKERAREARLRLETNFHGGLLLLRADERKLKQILINLISNSIKFTHAGGTVTLDVRCDRDIGYEFVVRDTGVGIAPEDIAKAMQPFGQIDNDLNRMNTGTGLGLPLAAELVEMHGGSLELGSELGVGTTVTVRFPADRIVQMIHGEAALPTSAGRSN